MKLFKNHTSKKQQIKDLQYQLDKAEALFKEQIIRIEADLRQKVDSDISNICKDTGKIKEDLCKTKDDICRAKDEVKKEVEEKEKQTYKGLDSAMEGLREEIKRELCSEIHKIKKQTDTTPSFRGRIG